MKLVSGGEAATEVGSSEAIGGGGQEIMEAETEEVGTRRTSGSVSWDGLGHVPAKGYVTVETSVGKVRLNLGGTGAGMDE